MIKYEDHCCGCAVPAYPCIGNSCPNINVPVYYCDICPGDVYAEYEIEDGHYCEKCAGNYIKEVFNELAISEQAELLNIKLNFLEE